MFIELLNIFRKQNRKYKINLHCKITINQLLNCKFNILSYILPANN